MAKPTLRINEVFFSIQGESTRAGMPCVFVRLTGCPLRCRYCDTEYAFREGTTRSIDDILEEVCAHPAELVEITGGEPLAQKNVHDLIGALCDRGLTVLIETAGSLDISVCDPRSIRILDIKTPGSGEVDKNLWSNLDHLHLHDEIKFVICDRDDYDWARQVILDRRLDERCAAVILSPVFEQAAGQEIEGCQGLTPRRLAEWMLGDVELAGKVRMQTQLHKLIWDPLTRGV